MNDQVAPKRPRRLFLSHWIMPNGGAVALSVSVRVDTVSVASNASRRPRFSMRHLVALLRAGYDVRYVPGEPSPALTITPLGNGSWVMTSEQAVAWQTILASAWNRLTELGGLPGAFGMTMLRMTIVPRNTDAADGTTDVGDGVGEGAPAAGLAPGLAATPPAGMLPRAWLRGGCWRLRASATPLASQDQHAYRNADDQDPEALVGPPWTQGRPRSGVQLGPTGFVPLVATIL